MKIRLSQLGLVAAAGLCGLLLCCPDAARGAALGVRADGKKAAAKAHFKSLAEELNLTAAQRQQLKPILREEVRKLKALRAETGVSRQQKRAELRQIRRDAQARIKEILTPEQIKKWHKLRAEVRGRHHGR